ncbi:MAG TPA: DUF2231 domain-containing protein [Actinophytocola sp.]|jgi:hypothetical protein|uniref:DUF2231 domain-containing protein n=1 Tax=Actinophytocola sp. TaxID=1872138 RepID=UPI002F95033E
MPAFVFGLPLHPLVVHAVVVLVPLALLTGIAIAVWPAARRRYGWPVVFLAVLATLSIPVATSSGEELRDRLPENALIHTHAELGDQLLAFVAPMTIALAALVLLDRFRTARADGPGTTIAPAARWTRPAAVALAAVAVALAAVSAVQVVRIGDSGARAVWHNTKYVAPTHHGDDD